MNVESDWTVYRTRFLVRARQLTESLKFTDALGRQQSGQPGDYLVEIFDGLLSITPRKCFEDIYVPLIPSPGDIEIHHVNSPSQTVVRELEKDGESDVCRSRRHAPAVANARGSPLDAASLIVPRAGAPFVA